MKPYLIENGVSISSIWNDQPVILTYILKFWMQIFGFNFLSGRIFFFTCSILIIFLSQVLIDRKIQLSIFIYFYLAVLSIPGSIEVFSSALIVVPSLLFTLIAIFFYKKLRKGPIFAIGGAFAFSLAIGCKLTALTAFPAIIYIMFKKSGTVKTFYFNLFIILLFSFISLKFSLVNSSLINNHLIYSTSSLDKPTFLFRLIIYQPYLLLPFIQFFLYKKSQVINLYLIWFLTVIIIFSIYRPLWFHYNVYFSIPLILLTASFYNINIYYHKNITKNFYLSFIILTLLIPHNFRNNLIFQKQSAPISEKIINISEWLTKHNLEQKLLLTDTPILALRSNNMVYPELCVFSYKRKHTGALDDEYIYNLIMKKLPDIVIFIRDDLKKYPKTFEFLRQNLKSSNIDNNQIFILQ